MSKLRLTLAFGLIFSVLALGGADELEDFLKDQDLPDGLKININKLIDSNLGTIQDVLKGFDPTKLPDIPLLRKGKLTNGWLSKLSTLKRTGDSFLGYGRKILSLDLRIGYDILKYDFDYAFKLWFVQRYGKLNGTVEKLSINLQLYVDIKNNAIVLERLKIEKIGKLGLELEGTFGDKLRSFFGRIILNIAKYFITDAVEVVASRVIQEKINEFNNQMVNKDHQFTFVDLVKMNREGYVIDDYTAENY